MTKTFDQLFDSVIQYEGFYANVKGDRGGETYMGVARNSHPNWKGWNIIDAYKQKHGNIKWNQRIDNPELKQLVKDFYYHIFYQRYGIDSIADGVVQEIIFDWCVNSGRNGSKGVQRVLNSPFQAGLVVDGILGKKSIVAINACNPRILFDEIKAARIRYYYAIAERGDNMKFLEGWLRRIGGIKYEMQIL